MHKVLAQASMHLLLRPVCLPLSFLFPACSSPIRQQLYGMPRQQQLQLSVGVAQAFAGDGATAGSEQHHWQLQDGSGLALPQLPAREALSSRLAAAAAAGRAMATLPAANLGGASLAPLRDSFAAFSLHANGLLESVPEAGESPYQARSTPGGAVSSTASTAIPDAASPLTPASAFAAGGSPLLGSASRWATPGGTSMHQLLQQQLSPGGLLAAPIPGGGSLGIPGSAARQQAALGSPLGALSDAPTPGAFSQHSQGAPGSLLRSPLSTAGTPQPDFGLLGAEGGGAGYSGGWGGGSSPYLDQLADAPTPRELGLQGAYEIRRFGCAGGGVGAQSGCGCLSVWLGSEVPTATDGPLAICVLKLLPFPANPKCPAVPCPQ